MDLNGARSDSFNLIFVPNKSYSPAVGYIHPWGQVLHWNARASASRSFTAINCEVDSWKMFSWFLRNPDCALPWNRHNMRDKIGRKIFIWQMKGEKITSDLWNFSSFQRRNKRAHDSDSTATKEKQQRGWWRQWSSRCSTKNPRTMESTRGISWSNFSCWIEVTMSCVVHLHNS